METILSNCEKEKIIITQGYICQNHLGEIDNLKRGGSDYTATLIGAAIHSTEIQIWSDIDGLQNNDPRWVKSTFTLSEISFESATNLAYFGAKILHPVCILPAMENNIPVRLKNTLNPSASGTLICKRTNKEEIKAVSAKDKIISFKLKTKNENAPHNFPDVLSSLFHQHNIKPIIRFTEKDVVDVLIEQNELSEKLLRSLEEVAIIEIERSQTIICVTGLQKFSYQEFINLLGALGDFPIKQTYFRDLSDHLLLIINSEYKKEILNKLNTIFFNIELILGRSNLAA